MKFWITRDELEELEGLIDNQFVKMIRDMLKKMVLKLS